MNDVIASTLAVLILVAAICGLFGLVGYVMGKTKGRQKAGFWLGFFFWYFGWFVIVLLDRSARCEVERELEKERIRAVLEEVENRQKKAQKNPNLDNIDYIDDIRA